MSYQRSPSAFSQRERTKSYRRNFHRVKKTLRILVRSDVIQPRRLSASLPLTPYPNQLELGQGVFQVGTRVSIDVTSNSEEDRFAASLLSGDLSSLDGVVAGKGKGSSRIVLARADSAAGKQILEKSGLQLPPRPTRKATFWWSLPMKPPL